MSYVLRAWEDPKPASHQEAEAIVDMLTEGPPRRRPQLALFSALMLARFPLAPRGDAVSAWSDSSIQSSADGGLLCFGLAPALRQEALAHTIRMARVADIVLQDDQSGLLHLPDGTALTSDGRLRMKDPPAGFWRVHADYLLAASLHAALAPRGWNLVESFPGWCQFSRLGRDGVMQKLVFNRRSQADALSFLPNLYLHLLPDEHSELLRRWPRRSTTTSYQTVAICYTLTERLGMPLQPDGSLPVSDQASLQVLAQNVEKALQPLHPSLDACLDLLSFDRAVNGFLGAGAMRQGPLALNPAMSDQSLAGALIVAHLSDAGRLDAVRKLVEEQIMLRATAHPVREAANPNTECMDDALAAIAGLTPAYPSRTQSMH